MTEWFITLLTYRTKYIVRNYCIVSGPMRLTQQKNESQWVVKKKWKKLLNNDVMSYLIQPKLAKTVLFDYKSANIIAELSTNN